MSTRHDTHVTALFAALMETDGPVLELGCGPSSTPLLHALCSLDKRRLVSCETKPEWFEKYLPLSADWHEFRLVPENWDAVDLLDRPGWGVVLVDQAPGESRTGTIRRLRENAEILVVHDTEAPGYGWGDVFDSFPHRIEFRQQNPATTVVSMKPLTEFMKCFPLLMKCFPLENKEI